MGFKREKYLHSLMRETYLKDIIKRNKIQNVEALEELVDMVASGIGGLTNAAKLERRFKSKKGVTLSAPTIRQYLDFMQDVFNNELCIRGYSVDVGEVKIHDPSTRAKGDRGRFCSQSRQPPILHPICLGDAHEGEVAARATPSEKHP